jgi:PAS domain S-box-containing protein
MTPVNASFMGKKLMVAATTYIDEFSAPVAAMEAKAAATNQRFQRFFSDQVRITVIVTTLFLAGLFCCVYLIGRRTALHYMQPIVHLAETAEKVGGGNWERAIDLSLIERKDEVGVLARSFESMRSQLYTLFKDLQDRLTELNQTQQSLKESEAHFRGLYDGVPVGLYRTTFNGRIIDANPTLVRMLGYPSRELFISKRAEEMYANPDDRFEWQTVIEESGVKHVHEVQMRRYDHSIIWVENHSRTVRGLAGSILYIEGSLIDISYRKEMEKQLQMAQRMEAIGTLAGGLAHDFNNLMMGILGNASIMLLDMATDHPHYAKLKKIETLVQSGSKLTSQLLGYARKGKVELNAFDLSAIVSDSIEVFARTRKEISVHLDLSPAPIAIEADYSQIEQVLLNLFINAADAMPDGGDLRLTTTTVQDTEMEAKPYKIESGRYAMLRVADSGHGMEPETRSQVFDPFFTTKEMGRGTGLGLASAYGIIKAHAGYIDVDSTPGKGSVFTIYLPLSNKNVAQASDGGPAIRFGKGTILIVDDEEMILDVGIEMVRKMGYETLAAKNGDEAVSLFKDHAADIDLVVLDLIMPGTSGKDTFNRLKKIRPDIKILLSSGYSIDSQARALMDQGCDGFIQKPYQLDALSAKIDEILR